MVSQKFAKFEAVQKEIEGTLCGLIDRIGSIRDVVDWNDINVTASIETIDSKLQALEKKADDGATQLQPLTTAVEASLFRFPNI